MGPVEECRRALAGHDAETGTGRERLSRRLSARRWAADVVRDDLVERLRPAGLPVGHVLHPGLDWVRRRVLGGALDLGLGAVGLDPADPDGVVLLPQPLLEASRLDAEVLWQSAEAYLDSVGAVAAERLRLDRAGRLRPVGDCDVVTLLGACSLRTAIATEADGLGAVVVPMRRRGWTRLALIDPAFGAAAAAATSPHGPRLRPAATRHRRRANAGRGGREPRGAGPARPGRRPAVATGCAVPVAALAEWLVPSRRLVLASASPARLRLLRDAGLSPEVMVSGIDESTVSGTAREQVAALARTKAEAVATTAGDALVLGCDSLLELDGQAFGKPRSAAEVIERWHQMRGCSGTLLTGHCLVDGDRVAEQVAATTVRFGAPTDREIQAYVASGEPLHVAGAFTLDGRSAPFVDSVDGNPGNVIGLSLPLLRDLLRHLDVELVDLWC